MFSRMIENAKTTRNTVETNPKKGIAYNAAPAYFSIESRGMPELKIFQKTGDGKFLRFQMSLWSPHSYGSYF